MGTIIKNNIIYGGGGNSKMCELTQAEYDALTTQEKNNGTVYYITDVNDNNNQFQPIIYSENEREIGVWVDGKPLYQKTFELTIPDGSGAYEHEFTEAAIPNLDKAVKTSYSLGIGERAYIPWYSQATVILDEQTATGVTFYFGSNNYTGRIIYYTVCYTKTTDTAGSGTWTPQGVPAVHYSTDEQIVGTWIDGSTIYEKTFINLSQSTSGTLWISLSQIDASGWDQLIDLKIYSENNSGTYIGMALAEFSLDNSTPTHPSMSLCGSFDRTITKAICRYTKSS